MQRLWIFQGKSRSLVGARRSPRGSPQSYPQIDPKGSGFVNQWFSRGSSSAAFGNSAKSRPKTGAMQRLHQGADTPGFGAEPVLRQIPGRSGAQSMGWLAGGAGWRCFDHTVHARRRPERTGEAQPGAFRECPRSVNCFTDTDKPCRALSN